MPQPMGGASDDKESGAACEGSQQVRWFHLRCCMSIHQNRKSGPTGTHWSFPKPETSKFNCSPNKHFYGTRFTFSQFSFLKDYGLK
eukprot:69001-Amphidinium_carterae.1